MKQEFCIYLPSKYKSFCLLFLDRKILGKSLIVLKPRFNSNPVPLSASSNISLKLGSQRNGIIIPWSTITVQAITQDHPRSVYFMIDVNINLFNGDQQPAAPDEPMNGNGDENNDDSDEGNGSVDSDHNITEFWLLPDNAEAVDEIYNLMTKYPENPPRNEDLDSDDDQFYDGNDVGDDMAQMQIDGELKISLNFQIPLTQIFFQITISLLMLKNNSSKI